MSANYRELEELKKEYSNPSVQVDLEKTQVIIMIMIISNSIISIMSVVLV